MNVLKMLTTKYVIVVSPAFEQEYNCLFKDSLTRAFIVVRVSYGVVIPARNEATSIRHTLRSLFKQSIMPNIVVVVDDSSEDETSKVAEDEGAIVISVHRGSKAPATGTPYLAFIINQGFSVLEEFDLDFVMVSGAESIYPKRYVESLVARMVMDRVVVASGIAYGERSLGKLSVRGSGRLINSYWFRQVGFRYPLVYGFETWLLLKALATGFDVAIYDDIVFYQLRRTSMSPRKAYFYGKAMKTLGYPSIYVLGRAARMLLQHDAGHAIYMLRGYLKEKTVSSDVAGIAKRTLVRELLGKGLKVLARLGG